MRTEKTTKTTERVARKAHNGADAAEERIDRAMDAFSARLATLETRLRDQGDKLLSNAREAKDTASEQVRAHPLAAFGIAFAAGITIARLLRR